MMKRFASYITLLFGVLLFFIIGTGILTYWALENCEYCYEANPLINYNGYLGIMLNVAVFLGLALVLYALPYYSRFNKYIDDLQTPLAIALIIGIVIRGLDFFNDCIVVLQYIW